jgi:hypothetical protein
VVNITLAHESWLFVYIIVNITYIHLGYRCKEKDKVRLSYNNITEKTKVIPITATIKKLKWRWTGHMAWGPHKR